MDAEAEALEHAVSPRVEQALAAFLGEPLEDPHGHPIPTREGVLDSRQLRPLCDFQPGDRVVIREAQDDDPERLRRWRALGLTPGAVVHIVGHQPLDDLFQIEVGGNADPDGPRRVGRAARRIGRMISLLDCGTPFPRISLLP